MVKPSPKIVGTVPQHGGASVALLNQRSGGILVPPPQVVYIWSQPGAQLWSSSALVSKQAHFRSIQGLLWPNFDNILKISPTPTHILVEGRPHLAELGRSCPECGRILANIGRHVVSVGVSAEFGPSPADVGRTRAKLGRFWATGQIWPIPDRIWPMVVGLRPNWSRLA